MEENLQVEIAANDAYERWRREGSTRYRNSRRSPGGATNPYEPPELPEGRINTSDPDSRAMRTQRQPLIQGYNAQAAVNEKQIILAAEVTVDPPDFGHLEPMVNATLRELQSAGVSDLPETVVADAGYWHKTQMQRITDAGIEVLVPPDGGLREGTRPGWNEGLYALMRQTLSTDRGRALYRQRTTTVEPVFGQIKFNRRIDRFQRRGRSAARSEWRLVAATHNVLKLTQPLDSQHRLDDDARRHPRSDTETAPRNRPIPTSSILRRPRSETGIPGPLSITENRICSAPARSTSRRTNP